MEMGNLLKVNKSGGKQHNPILHDQFTPQNVRRQNEPIIARLEPSRSIKPNQTKSDQIKPDQTKIEFFLFAICPLAKSLVPPTISS
jgi:hypothetical protein